MFGMFGSVMYVCLDLNWDILFFEFGNCFFVNQGFFGFSSGNLDLYVNVYWLLSLDFGMFMVQELNLFYFVYQMSVFNQMN